MAAKNDVLQKQNCFNCFIITDLNIARIYSFKLAPYGGSKVFVHLKEDNVNPCIPHFAI